MRLRPSVVTIAEGAAAAFALLLAAVTGEVVLIVFAAPLGMAAAIGLARRSVAEPSVRCEAAPLLAAVGEPVTITVEVEASEPASILVQLELPMHVEPLGTTCFAARLRRGRAESFTFEVVAERPGRFPLGSLRLEYGPPERAVTRLARVEQSAVLEVRPARSRTGALPRSHRVRAAAGDRVSALGGEGIEFAEVREETGAVLRRRVNWRATARSGQTCVNVFHPERSTDVVLLVDTFSGVALPSIVSAAVNAAEAYLAAHDRVGVICFGGVLDWVEPGTGPLQAERVRRSLLESESFFSYAWKTAAVIPPRLLPRSALVLALSPLADRRFTAAVTDLRARGADVAVVEVAPPRPPLPRQRRAAEVASLAERIIALEREELRYQFSSWGIPVTTLFEGDSLGLALARLGVLRRRARQAGVGRLGLSSHRPAGRAGPAAGRTG